ncbi:MAG: FlgD immunoglobulin-like domain containing protein, partial [Candidatus Eisenbacteria bacterium]
TETVDANGITGRNTSLALDRTGEPVIAYTARTGKGSFRVASASVQFGGKPADNGGQVAPARSLAAWPLPYKGGALNVSFVIPSRGGAAEVRMIDLAGRHVRTLTRGTAEAGRQVIAWDGRDDSGRNVANGVYFLVARTGGAESKLKLVVLR